MDARDKIKGRTKKKLKKEVEYINIENNKN